jgi:hypothetical protein
MAIRKAVRRAMTARILLAAGATTVDVFTSPASYEHPQ